MQEYLNVANKWIRSLINSFLADQCILRAAALTYVTALSIVPLLAVVFSISKGFGFYNTEYIKNILLEFSAGREVVVEHLISYIHGTNVATLGAVGLVFLLVTVFSLISNIEQSLNVIWGASSSRTLRRKFTDYLSVILICPFLVILAFSFSATMESSELVQNILSIYVLNSLYWFLFRFQARDGELQIPTKGEFLTWKWIRFRWLLEKTAQFRKPVYEQLAGHWNRYLR